MQCIKVMAKIPVVDRLNSEISSSFDKSSSDALKSKKDEEGKKQKLAKQRDLLSQNEIKEANTSTRLHSSF